MKAVERVLPPYNHDVLAAIVAQRELNWPDFHPEDYCHRCGGINPSWSIDSDRFNAAMGSYDAQQWNGIVCVGCFVQLHEAATGLRCTWQLTPLTGFRPIEVTPLSPPSGERTPGVPPWQAGRLLEQQP